jgi:hypothetical protein
MVYLIGNSYCLSQVFSKAAVKEVIFYNYLKVALKGLFNKMYYVLKNSIHLELSVLLKADNKT